MNKDNRVAIGDRGWQLENARFRHSLTGTTMTIHEHLDETVSIRYGPHVVGRFNALGESLREVENAARKSRGKDGPHRPDHRGSPLPENQESAFGQPTRIFGRRF